MNSFNQQITNFEVKKINLSSFEIILRTSLFIFYLLKENVTPAIRN